LVVVLVGSVQVDDRRTIGLLALQFAELRPSSVRSPSADRGDDLVEVGRSG
jgi:hypothetical protein